MASFNPRLRVGGDFSFYDIGETFEDVSIHASAWEATCDARVCVNIRRVSIHASAWEATVK